MNNPIRLLLVDDEFHVRRGLTMAFSAEPDLEVVGEAATGEDGVLLAGSLQPDVVVMDVRLRKLDGLDATREIRDQSPSVRVVVLSLLDDALTRRAARDAGAGAFVGKQEGSDALLFAIREVAAAS